MQGWANFSLNNGENLVPHGGFQIEIPSNNESGVNLESHSTNSDPLAPESCSADCDSVMAIAKLGFCDFHR